MTHDPKKTMLGWIPNPTESQTQPFAQPSYGDVHAAYDQTQDARAYPHVASMQPSYGGQQSAWAQPAAPVQAQPAWGQHVAPVQAQPAWGGPASAQMPHAAPQMQYGAGQAQHAASGQVQDGASGQAQHGASGQAPHVASTQMPHAAPQMQYGAGQAQHAASVPALHAASAQMPHAAPQMQYGVGQAQHVASGQAPHATSAQPQYASGQAHHAASAQPQAHHAAAGHAQHGASGQAHHAASAQPQAHHAAAGHAHHGASGQAHHAASAQPQAHHAAAGHAHHGASGQAHHAASAQPPYAAPGQAHHAASAHPPYAVSGQAQYAASGQTQHAASRSARGSYPPAAAYNYAPAAAVIVSQMQRDEQQAKDQAKTSSQPSSSRSSRSSSPRPIPGADATRGVSDRLRFIRLTYLHLLGAILAFAGLLWLLMNNAFLASKVSAPLVRFALGGRWNWGVVLAAFMAVSWIADYWASHTTSRKVQYLGLGAYVVAEALIFVPLLAVVAWKTQVIIAKGGGDPNIIRDAAYVTLGIFAALTASVFISKRDFSFLRSGLVMASGAALTLIVLALTFGFNLGLAFSAGMVLLAAGYILYQTSQVLAHYDPNQHVAASLALFSSVALMFWYVIRIFMRMREG